MQVHYGPGFIGGLKTRPTPAQVLDGKPKFSIRRAGLYPAAHNSEMKKMQVYFLNWPYRRVENLPYISSGIGWETEIFNS